MSILIKGMEMPTEEYGSMTITIYPNGSVMEYIGDIGRSLGNAVPVPKHGDLIDRDKFRSTVFIGEQCLYSWDELEDAIDYAPTIIPAEEATQKDGRQDAAPTGPYDLLYEEGGYSGNGI